MPRRSLLPVSDTTRERAKTLRRDSTAPERILWSILQRKRLEGLKFRRQHPIEPYIVDFYCAEALLVVELDGESHVGRADDDERRTAFLQSKGLHVVRFTNDDVLQHLEAVAASILAAASKRTPLPRREGLGEG